MYTPNREQLHGTLGTILFHIVLLVILLLVAMDTPQQQEEAGLSVVMGNVETSSGDGYDYTEVMAAPQPSEVETAVPLTDASVDEPLMTQTEELTVELPESQKDKEEKKQEKTPEQLEQERKAREAEQARREAERLARIANERIAGAFGKGATMKGSGSSQQGNKTEGSVDGNSTTGVTSGMGGYGTFDLNGRSLVGGGLPRPVYNVQEEGRVVVTIIVNSVGKVIHAEINRRTNTANQALRKAALDAAKKAVFNSIEDVNNQTGTITYYFTLR